jgi:hypothetical protein
MMQEDRDRELLNIEKENKNEQENKEVDNEMENEEGVSAEESRFDLPPDLAMYEPWIRVVRGRQLPGLWNTDHQIFAAQAAQHRCRTYSHVPRGAIEAFLACVRPALQVMAGALEVGDDLLFTRALQCLCIVPQFCFG